MGRERAETGGDIDILKGIKLREEMEEPVVYDPKSTARTVMVYVNDYEHFEVLLEGEEPITVRQVRTVWACGDKAVSNMMSERVRRIIDEARHVVQESSV